jgi:hypothetical protein
MSTAPLDTVSTLKPDPDDKRAVPADPSKIRCRNLVVPLAPFDTLAAT